MKQFIINIGLSVSSLLFLISCESLNNDSLAENTIDNAKVYLNISIRSADNSTGFKSVNRSINVDNENAEDFVHNIAMFIFDSSTGNVAGKYYNAELGSGTSTTAFKAEVTPGIHDFYFVANIADLATVLNEISTRSDIDSYLSKIQTLDSALYRGANLIKGFPMSRVYLNQDIKEGGTIYQPLPFKPKQYDNEENAIIVNSAGNGNIEKPYVELMRVVAKLEVIFDDISLPYIEKVYFRNANRNFRLNESTTIPTDYFNDNSTDSELKNIEGTNRYIYYMPEAMTEGAAWGTDSKHRPINYFTVIMRNGTYYDIPIITHNRDITEDYINKATGGDAGFLPNYNIYRNHQYQFRIKIIQNIEVIYEASSWDIISSSLYMGYGYNVKVDEEGIVTINNTAQACDPHKVTLKTINGFTFDDENGSTEAEFTNLDADAIGSYKITPLPEQGIDYLEVYFNDVHVKTFKK